MFTERTIQRRQEIRHIAPRATVTPLTRPNPRVSVVEPKPSTFPSLLNTALNTASQLINLTSIREKVRLEQARAAIARAEAAALPPTIQPPGDLVTRRQEFPWTFVLLGGGALILALFLFKRK